VESIKVTQSELGRIFDYGVLVVVIKSGMQEAFPFIAGPMDFCKRINEQTRKTAGSLPISFARLKYLPRSGV